MSKLLISKMNQNQLQVLQYGDEKIDYRVFFITSHKPKIVIDVLPNGSVQVKAPESTQLKDVKKAVHKRARWVYNHVAKIKRQYAHVLPRHYVSGESHYYLGRRYLLKIKQLDKHSKTNKHQVKLIQGQLQIFTTTVRTSVIKSLLAGWYLQHAETTFKRRIKALSSEIIWLESAPKWKLRTMKKQWGSCSPKKVIALNPQLIKAPRECVDYVILHEICHIKEHNHSKKFYNLLSQVMPEWEAVKSKLDNMSELLLSE